VLFLARMTAPSALDRPITLAELIDAASLEEVLRSFAELHGVQLALVDTTGKLMMHAGTPAPLCDAICDRPAGKAKCEGRREELIRQAVAGEQSIATQSAMTGGPTCFCGQRYQSHALLHEGSRLGALVLGPYWPEDRPPQPAGAVQQLLGPTGLDEAERALAHTRKVSDGAAKRVLDHLARVLQVVLHTAYARHLAGQLHLAAIQDAYAEVSDKNKRLNEAVDRMQEADRIKSNFLATVSHELRTPLTSVIGYSEMLLEGLAGPLNEEQREYVHTIMEKGDALLQIISGILDVSRMESGTLRLAREAVDLRDVIGTAISALQPAFKRKRLALRPPAREGESPRVVGDRDKIRQVLMNLLGNAIKFTPEGGHIEVVVEIGLLVREEEFQRFASGESGEHARHGVRLRVRDDGIGIAKEKQARIFEPFFQVDSSSTREYGGTGLGLTLVKNLVEAQGGHVWVESELGRGSLFTVTLPQARADSQGDRATTAPGGGEAETDKTSASGGERSGA
jgi:two-component system, NarL family, sensor histidine kinase BarA